MSVAVTKRERMDLRPLLLAQLLYQRMGRGPKEFAQDLWEHLQDGFVSSSPRHFVMGRAVMLDDGRHAWLVTMAVGACVSDIVRMAPFPLECVAFHRHGQERLRVYNFDRLTRGMRNGNT
jgi:hypothetical protein